MKLKYSFLLNLYFVFLIVYIFTNHIYNIQSPLLIGMSLYLIVLELIFEKKIFANTMLLILIFFCVIVFLSSLRNYQVNETSRYIIVFLLLSFNLVYIGKIKTSLINFKLLYWCLFAFSGMHVFFTLLYQLNPSFMDKILPIFLHGEDLIKNRYLFAYQNINCGICGIQGANAMYISSFLMLCFSRLLIDKRKTFNVIFLIFGFIALFLSSKRGILISNIITMIISYMIYNSKYKRRNLIPFIKGSIAFLVVLTVGIVIINNYFPTALEIFSRFTNQADITTGRIRLYQLALSRYKYGNLILGTGLFSTRNYYLLELGAISDVHNVYIQLLTETGIAGLTSFIIFVVMLLKKVFRTGCINNALFYFISIYYIILFLIYCISGNNLFDLTMLPLWFLMIELLINIGGEKI